WAILYSVAKVQAQHDRVAFDLVNPFDLCPLILGCGANEVDGLWGASRVDFKSCLFMFADEPPLSAKREVGLSPLNLLSLALDPRNFPSSLETVEVLLHGAARRITERGQDEAKEKQSAHFETPFCEKYFPPNKEFSSRGLQQLDLWKR